MKFISARLLLASIALTGAIALGGCSALQQFLPASDPVRDAQTGEVTEGSDNADVFAIEVGDCLNTADMTESAEYSSVPIVPCGQPHDDEVYHAFELDDADEYPGEDEIFATADDVCYTEFEEFVGLNYDESVLLFWTMHPTVESWAGGDREVLCIIAEDGAQVTGTLAGAAR